jgi:hypothetical protein
VRQRPWNRSRRLGWEPPLKLREVWAIRIRLQIAVRVRNLALFDLAIDSKLRGCDLVQRKTGRPMQFELTKQMRDTVTRWTVQARGEARRHQPMEHTDVGEVTGR